MRKLTKLILGLGLGLLLTGSALAFDDVVDSDPYADSIDWMQENQVIEGYDDNTFRPEACVNRVELLKMVYVSLDLSEEVDDYRIDANWNQYFSDVDTAEWYWPYLGYALAHDTVNGYPDRTFRPSRCVLRPEAIKIAVEAFGDTGYRTAFATYPSDIDRNQWYFDYFEYVYAADLIGQDHVKANQYGIADSMSRAEVAEMLYRMKAVKDKGAEQYDDGLEPDPLVVTEGIITFDSCGSIASYSDSAWYDQLEADLTTEIGATNWSTNLLTEQSEACLALDGSVMVLVVQLADEQGSRVFKYAVDSAELAEATYKNFGDATNWLAEFGQRNNDRIPMSGQFTEAGVEKQQDADYDYINNIVSLERTCNLATDRCRVHTDYDYSVELVGDYRIINQFVRFGEQVVLPEAPNAEMGFEYYIKAVEQRTAADIIAEVESDELLFEGKQVELGNNIAVEYTAGGLCSYPTIEVVGNGHNYLLTTVCGSGLESEFVDLRQVAETITTY